MMYERYGVEWSGEERKKCCIIDFFLAGCLSGVGLFEREMQKGEKEEEE